MTDQVKPYSPEEAMVAGIAGIPNEVIEVVNALLAEGSRAGSKSVIIGQPELVKLLAEKGLTPQQLDKNNWLDFEQLYRDQGWTVVYDRPGYNESYDAGWEFSH